MPRIYLINVGANTAHARVARSPIFPDGRWVYVPFPNGRTGQPFPAETRPFVRVERGTLSHLDPDWDCLTYGDCCANRRARALLNVEPKDFLLFWGLLWKVDGDGGTVWDTKERGWYLFGAIRVQRVLKEGERTGDLPADARIRARQNAHVTGGRVEERRDVRVFVGQPARSVRFGSAVDLGVGDDHGLLRRIVRTNDGRLVEWNQSPRWNSATRSCRAILDLERAEDRKRADRLAGHIWELNKNVDLLQGC